MEIHVENVSYRFGEREVLTDFSADIEAGRVTALVGPSGSGKSTLLGGIAGYVKSATGRVTVSAGPQSPREAPRPEHIGWVPQGANALSGRTVLDNVTIGVLSRGISLREATGIAQAALEKVSLGDRVGSLARELSGGELQRIAFARALASGRPIILADEPTSSLDAANTQNIVELLYALRSTATVVVATHDPALIDAAERCINLREA